MIVDCLTCPVRGQRCEGCAVAVLGAPWTAEELRSSGERASSETPSASFAEVQLDAAESRVVSLFVVAGLVQAEAVATLRALRETELDVQDWGAVREVG